MERHESREDGYEYLIEQCQNNPEAIERLSDGEKEELLEALEARIVEQGAEWDPLVRDERRKIAQALRVALGEKRKTRSDDLIIADEYMISVGGERRRLLASVSESMQLGDLSLLKDDIPGLNRFDSRGWLILLTDEQKRFWINVKLFNAVDAQKQPHRVLYIADRYVTPALRGKQIGKQLSDIAERIALANQCELIFGKQVPEEASDFDRLVQSKERAGYVVDRRDDGIVLAKKRLK